MARDHREPIVVTPFRTLPAVDGRSRTVFITESRRGRSVRIENFNKDGQQVGGTMQVACDDLPAFLVALTDAAAAIGVAIPTEPDRAGLDRTLARARAL